MDQITILCTVPVADAIKAGKNKAGRYDHPLTEAEASELVQKKLAGHAAAYMRGAPGTNGVVQRLEVADASWPAIVTALEAVRSPSSDARRDKRRELDLLAEWGSKADYDRHAEGLLPEADLLGVARRVAFQRFDGCTRYDKQERLTAADLHHDPECPIRGLRREDQEKAIRYETVPAKDLSETAWEVLGDIRRIADRANADAPPTAGLGKFKVELRRHEAACKRCERGTFRDTVMVTVTWCGRTLSREFLLRG